jgi:hypothetical protein
LSCPAPRDRARCEIQKSGAQPSANRAERNIAEVATANPAGESNGATSFLLGGSSFAEATLFQWKMGDVSLMDAIACGIVMLPFPGDDMPDVSRQQ